MNPRVIELAVRRGALQERIAAQRRALAAHAPPLRAACAAGDAALRGVDWLKHHPAAVGGAMALLVVLRPARAWRWARRGFLAWRGWQAMRNSLFGGR